MFRNSLNTGCSIPFLSAQFSNATAWGPQTYRLWHLGSLDGMTTRDVGAYDTAGI